MNFMLLNVHVDTGRKNLKKRRGGGEGKKERKKRRYNG